MSNAPTMPPALPSRVTTSVAHNLREFRTAVSASFVPLNVTTSKPDPFWGQIRSTSIDEVHICEVSAARHTVERTPELIARSETHYFKLSLLLTGSGLLIQDGREAVMGPGDLAIYDTQRPYSLVFDDDFSTMVVMFPTHLIDLPADTVGRLTARKMSGEEGLGSMVAPFLTQLAGNLEQLNGSTATRLTHSALDLITTLLSNELDLTDEASHPHRVLMQRIHAYIDANLASPELGPAQISTAHFISTRHLHGLFQEQNTTVSSWIRGRRLERCRRDLLDPVLASRPVSAIAARWGFVDAAHFSRVFKAAHGMSPSELRNTAA